ncbi:MAG: AAA family ATPase [Candidatus Thiodiazotropha sp.]
MYLDTLNITNFRTFRKAEIQLSHWERVDDSNFPTPKLPNINLLLGNNGGGKTTFLKAIALAALGPAVSDAGIYPYRLIRREPNTNDESPDNPDTYARIRSTFCTHDQDNAPYGLVESEVTVSRKGDLEQLRWTHADDKLWYPIFSSKSDAFFIVGYGASRRVEPRDQSNISGRARNSFQRAQRIQSLFEEDYSLLPLSAWLPQYKSENPGRYVQVVNLINTIMGKDHYQFTGEIEQGEYIFERRGLQIPFPALSDGYRAFLGWVGDLLYHVCITCPSGKKLVDNHGIVMVDEIDLHIHPKWQFQILPRLSRALPNIQFIVTSHSPLVVGSLEWMNIIVMSPERGQAFRPKRVEAPVHGLDADQILLTEFFGMGSTRVKAKQTELEKLTESAREGNHDAAKQLLRAMTKGMEK